MIFSIELLAPELPGPTGAPAFVHHAARRRPGPIRPENPSLLVATDFVIHFVPLLGLLARVAPIVLWLL